MKRIAPASLAFLMVLVGCSLKLPFASGTAAPSSNPALDHLDVSASLTDLQTPQTLSHFNTVWLEPYAWSIGRAGSALGTITSADLRYAVDLLASTYKVNRIVIAYSEYLHCFVYDPWKAYSWLTWWEASPMTVSSSSPGQRCPVVHDAKDPYANFVGVVMDEAKKEGLKVVIGLSRIDDLELLNDMANYYLGSTQIPLAALNSRLQSAIYYSEVMAQDLFQQYGTNPAFDGWYLAHETTYLDVGMNYYGPVGTYLKSLNPSKHVMISPDITVSNLFGASYESMVSAYKGSVDEYAYQDGVGAGFLSSNGILYYTDAARNQQISDLAAAGGRISQLQGIHSRTGTRFIMNVEAWEMNGNCPNGTAGGNPYHPNLKYGCNYPGSWTRVEKQLRAYQNYTADLMMNEGLLQLVLAGADTSYIDPNMQQEAIDFSLGYQGYLKGQ